jgi:hypothetical protein
MTSTEAAAALGLTTAEAERRLASDGPNYLGAIRRESRRPANRLMQTHHAPRAGNALNEMRG